MAVHRMGLETVILQRYYRWDCLRVKRKKELEATLSVLVESGGIRAGVTAKYEKVLAGYREKMIGYSHKDQKPYWH